MARPGDFLFQRTKGGKLLSQNWYVQFIFPPSMVEEAAKRGVKLARKHVESMHTDDRVLARARSAPMVEAFKAACSMHRFERAHAHKAPDVFAKLAALTSKKTFLVPPGRHENEDGTVTIATERSVMTLDRDGVPVLGSERPNCDVGERVSVTVPDVTGGKPFVFAAVRKAGEALPPFNATRLVDETARDLDMEILDNWSQEGEGVDPRFVKEAKDTLAFWRKHRPGRTFANSDWDDGRELADLLASELGNKSATVRKKIAFLRRAFVLAKRSPRRFPQLVGRENPFSAVVRDLNDAQDKVMFDDADTALIKARMGELGRDERVLLTWCLALGCRRGEPFNVVREFKLDGFRSIRFEEKDVKNAASDRTIPLPPVLLDLHPEPISGPIFADNEVNIGKRINAWFRKIGITDPSKTLHSTRHRAAYKLRGFEDSVRWEALGHENRSEPSEEYGAYPQAPLFEALKTVW